MTLLVFKVNQLGDNVVFLPVVQQLAKQHPDWRIIVATAPPAAPLYRITCPQIEVHEFITADFNSAWRHPARLSAHIKHIRTLRPGACLLGNDQGNVAHLLARLSRARHCIGPHVPGRHLGALLHHRVLLPETDSAAQQNWRIAQALLVRLSQPSLPEQIPAPDLSAFGCEPHGSIIIHAGASRAYKRWPLERFIALANQLCRTHPVIWFDQNSLEEAVLSPGIRRIAPGTLADFIRLIAGARHFIGNNSGPMNIASALGIPSTIFNGPSRANWDPVWHPECFDLLRDPTLACQPCDHFTHPVNHCQNKAQPMACMERWSVETVHARVLSRLSLAATTATSPPA